MTKTLEENIIHIPPDGFWKQATQAKFIVVGEQLLQKGFTEDEVLALLDTLYWAVSAEYGS